MMEVLTTVPLENIDGIKQTVDAITPLLQTPSELSEETQVRCPFT